MRLNATTHRNLLKKSNYEKLMSSLELHIIRQNLIIQSQFHI